MSLSNSYVRASIVTLALFVAGSLRYFQKYGDVRDNRHVTLVLLINGTATLLTILLVGTFSRRSVKPWPWPKVSFVSFGCWLAVVCLMALAQKIYSRR